MSARRSYHESGDGDHGPCPHDAARGPQERHGVPPRDDQQGPVRSPYLPLPRCEQRPLRLASEHRNTSEVLNVKSSGEARTQSGSACQFLGRRGVGTPYRADRRCHRRESEEPSRQGPQRSISPCCGHDRLGGPTPRARPQGDHVKAGGPGAHPERQRSGSDEQHPTPSNDPPSAPDRRLDVPREANQEDTKERRCNRGSGEKGARVTRRVSPGGRRTQPCPQGNPPRHRRSGRQRVSGEPTPNATAG